MKFKAKDGKINAMVWNAEAQKPLCQFKDGFANVEDKVAIEKLKHLGYETVGEQKADKVVAEPKEKADKKTK